MNTRQSQAFATRAASLLASVAVTAVLVGSQLGIADTYARQADAVLAARQAPQPVAQRVAHATRRAS